MSLIEFEGFDLRDFALPLPGWASVLGATSTTTPFSVGSSWVFTSSGATPQAATYSFTAVSKIFCGFACAISSSTNFGIAIYGDAGATNHLTLMNAASGVLNLYRGVGGGTLIASSAAGALGNDGAFRYLEVSAVISDTVGTFEAKVNGVVVLTFSGDTKNAGTNTTIDAVKIGWVIAGSNGPTGTVDDFYLCSDAGSVNNSYLGPWARVQTLKPSGAGASTQFTPLSGSNFSNVNDVPDNTATYNSDTVSGHRDTFALDDTTTVGAGTVYGVKQIMHARQLDGGTATIKQAQKSGATVSYGATKTLTASNAAYRDLFETNPAGGAAWTLTDVNALEAGYEVV